MDETRMFVKRVLARKQKNVEELKLAAFDLMYEAEQRGVCWGINLFQSTHLHLLLIIFLIGSMSNYNYFPENQEP